MSTITLSDISHAYDGTTVLDNISLTLTERRIGIAGLNGSGKSTFIRLLNGLVLPTQGTVDIEGKTTARHTAQIRKSTGFVFSEPTSQIIMPTVIDDIEFSLRRYRLSRQERQERAKEILCSYGLEEYAHHSPYTLSGGQRQLLAIAAVMATNPSLLLADEPTALLDLRNAHYIRELFRTLSPQIIVVSHDLELLGDMDRILVLHQGTIVKDAPPDVALPFYRKLALS